MNLSQKLSKELHEIISNWLKVNGIANKDVDYEITIKQIPRKFVSIMTNISQEDLDALLSTTVSDFLVGKKSSTRLTNILDNSNFTHRTLGNLVRMTARHMRKYRQSGKHTVEELEKILGTEGLSLGMNVKIGPQEEKMIRHLKDVDERRWAEQRE